MIIASTAITIKIPTPIPALNIPSIMEQLVNESSTTKSISNLVSFFCMVLLFLMLNFNFLKLQIDVTFLLYNFYG